jgi:hypothetical protein
MEAWFSDGEPPQVILIIYIYIWFKLNIQSGFHSIPKPNYNLIQVGEHEAGLPWGT